jgi:selenocysteine-specific elongation factor
MEVEEFVRGSFLDTDQNLIVPVSSLTGAGLDVLKRALVSAASAVTSKSSAALARLPIDRVFTMKGFGAVVTGTLISGAITKEDELEIVPGGRRVRVRGVQVHGRRVERAIAGERTALNLTDIRTEELARGLTLAPAGVFQATSQLDVSLAMLSSAKILRDRARVHFHAYTSETIAEVKLYGTRQLGPGESGMARLRLQEPILLLPGDHFIIRQFSPVTTIGGGVVLDAAPLPKASSSVRVQFLAVLSKGGPAAILEVRIARRGPKGLSLAQAVSETGWRQQKIESYLQESLRKSVTVRTGELLISTDMVKDLKLSALQVLSKYHDANPLVSGINKESLRMALKIEPTVFDLIIGTLVCEKKLEITGELAHLPGRGVAMKDEEAESQQIIEQAFASAGLKVPALKDVLASLKLDKTRAQKLVTLMLRDKILVKISEDLVFHRSALEGLRRMLSMEKSKSSKIDVARFKDMTGVSRKYAIPLLEYLDRERVTRREGDVRVIL